MGAKVVTCSDSTGWVYDPEGIDLAALKEIQEVKRGRVSDYLNYRPNAEYHSGKGVWSVKVELSLIHILLFKKANSVKKELKKEKFYYKLVRN